MSELILTRQPLYLKKEMSLTPLDHLIEHLHILVAGERYKEKRMIKPQLKLQEIKDKLLDDLISEDNLSTKNLSKNDIEFILGN